MGMAHRLLSAGSSYQFVGTKCNRNEGINQHSTFGYTTPIWGLQVKPCTRCAGTPITPGPVGGATACGELAVLGGHRSISSSFVWLLHFLCSSSWTSLELNNCLIVVMLCTTQWAVITQHSVNPAACAVLHPAFQPASSTAISTGHAN
jgi:hypothetical protein